jgi:integral membrane protein
MKRDPRFLKLLATLSVTQAASFIVLLGVAVPVKYFAGYDGGVTMMGALHGVLWLLYMWVVLAMATLKMWDGAQILRLVFSPLLPFGGFATARWINRISGR